MTSRHSTRIALALLLVPAAVSWSVPAAALATHPRRGKDVGELLFDGDGAEAVSEELTLDFRGIARPTADSTLNVRAIYRVRADRDGATLRVQTREFQGDGLALAVDGERVQATSGPGSGASAQSAYELALASGEHTLEVRYETSPYVTRVGESSSMGIMYALWPSPSAPPAGQSYVTVIPPAGWSVQGVADEARGPADGSYRTPIATFRTQDTAFQGTDELYLLCVPPQGRHALMWVVNVLCMLAALLAPQAVLHWTQGARLQLQRWPRLLALGLACNALSVLLPVAGVVLGFLIFPLADGRLLFAAVLGTWVVGIAFGWRSCLALRRAAVRAYSDAQGRST